MKYRGGNSVRHKASTINHYENEKKMLHYKSIIFVTYKSEKLLLDTLLYYFIIIK